MLCVSLQVHRILEDIYLNYPTTSQSIAKRLDSTSKEVASYSRWLIGNGLIEVLPPHRLNGIRIPSVYWPLTPCGCGQWTVSELGVECLRLG